MMGCRYCRQISGKERDFLCSTRFPLFNDGNQLKTEGLDIVRTLAQLDNMGASKMLSVKTAFSSQNGERLMARHIKHSILGTNSPHLFPKIVPQMEQMTLRDRRRNPNRKYRTARPFLCRNGSLLWFCGLSIAESTLVVTKNRVYSSSPLVG